MITKEPRELKPGDRIVWDDPATRERGSFELEKVERRPDGMLLLTCINGVVVAAHPGVPVVVEP